MKRTHSNNTPTLDARQRTQAANTGGVSTGTVRETDIGEGERATKENLSESGVLFSNQKRTMDEYQKISLEHSQNAQQAFQQATMNLQGQLAQLNAVTLQAIQNSVVVTAEAHQNAVETANMTGKQAVKHADLAADALWNPVQAGVSDALTGGAYTPNRAVDTATATVGASAAAIAAAVAKAVDASNVPLMAVLQQVVSALATTNASIANVLAQSQPKK
jgi:hypothetical protein